MLPLVDEFLNEKKKKNLTRAINKTSTKGPSYFRLSTMQPKNYLRDLVGLTKRYCIQNEMI